MTPKQRQRRYVLAFLATSALYAALPLPLLAAPAATAELRMQPPAQRESALKRLEERHGGRLGVYVYDAENPAASYGLRSDDRFAMCSTFKLLLAAIVLREADAGRLDLEAPIRFGKDDLVAYSPFVEKHLAKGRLTIAELAEGTHLTSDNAAANLLLRQLGGPAAVTAKLRDWGDSVTRIDRLEPTMNRVLPGEEHDTSTPRAMAETVARVFTGDGLSEGGKQRLKAWMIATQTGQNRLRAGFPADWVAGDKTGTAYFEGAGNKVNDVAVVWREGRAPLVVAAFYEAADYAPRIRAEDEAVLAAVGRIAAGAD